ncbi:glycine, alanine and asparagine-rich protein-like [Episyrphus balteatus]|uniref:glycine, alanine and asparagine-rich protein-like n=1 Tax=Episyrphus balteatus TaxID=286459 RepID=UPI00248659B1|nr:glycine, alanine and asparagine-rich protein-like [Episyrphus balteatus]
MRAFVILSVIAVASAGRLGYNYQQGVSGSNDYASSGSGLNSVLALGNGQGQGLGGADFGGQAQGSGISYGLSSGSIGSGLGGGIGFGSSGGQSFGSGSSSIGGSGLGGSGISYGSSSGSSGSVGGGVSYQPGSNRVIDGGLTKEYFIYSAPEEQVQQGQNTESIETVIKKNLRVIFIKAPENSAVHNAALQVAKQATEDRTAIYVLSKEPDVSEITSQVQQISENVRAKPEVRFIKYRTNEDALNAQRTIQQQYEALGGTSQSSNEGVAPVLNFASPAAAGHHAGHAHGVSGGSNLIASGSSISSSSSSPALNIGSASEQSSQSVNLGSIGSSSNNVAVKSQNEYLPPAVKK